MANEFALCRWRSARLLDRFSGAPPGQSGVQNSLARGAGQELALDRHSPPGGRAAAIRRPPYASRQLRRFV